MPQLGHMGHAIGQGLGEIEPRNTVEQETMDEANGELQAHEADSLAALQHRL